MPRQDGWSSEVDNQRFSINATSHASMYVPWVAIVDRQMFVRRKYGIIAVVVAAITNHDQIRDRGRWVPRSHDMLYIENLIISSKESLPCLFTELQIITSGYLVS